MFPELSFFTGNVRGMRAFGAVFACSKRVLISFSVGDGFATGGHGFRNDLVGLLLAGGIGGDGEVPGDGRTDAFGGSGDDGGFTL